MRERKLKNINSFDVKKLSKVDWFLDQVSLYPVAPQLEQEAKGLAKRNVHVHGVDMLNKYLMCKPYDRDYDQANREHINQQHRENYAKHRDEHNAKRRAHSTTRNAVTFYSSRNRTVPPARCAT